MEEKSVVLCSVELCCDVMVVLMWKGMPMVWIPVCCLYAARRRELLFS